VVAGASECAEVSRHCAGIMRNEHTMLFGSQRQNLGVVHLSESGRLRGRKIQRWLPADHPAHNGSVQIGIRQKSNLHERRAI
jgi:hypothetical protein